MPTCKHCKCEKPNREMATWGGAVTETCLECKAVRKAGRAGAKNGVAPAPAPLPTIAPKQNGHPAEIVVEASLGFAAKVDGESLVISQANSSRENDDDNITLTRSEAKVLFAKYSHWVGLDSTEAAA